MFKICISLMLCLIPSIVCSTGIEDRVLPRELSDQEFVQEKVEILSFVLAATADELKQLNSNQRQRAISAFYMMKNYFRDDYCKKNGDEIFVKIRFLECLANKGNLDPQAQRNKEAVRARELEAQRKKLAQEAQSAREQAQFQRQRFPQALEKYVKDREREDRFFPYTYFGKVYANKKMQEGPYVFSKMDHVIRLNKHVYA